MSMSKGDQAALKAAQDIIAKGQASGDADAVAEGTRVQNNILANNGIIYPSGNKGANVDTSTTPLPKSWGGTGISLSGKSSGGGSSGSVSYAEAVNKTTQSDVNTAAESELKKIYDALESELKGLYGENGLYASALAEQQKANQASVDKTVNTLEGQKQSTTQSYAEMFRQLYRQKKNAQKNIGQQMAAQGVTGGASESTLLGLETDYSEALRQGNQGRADALGELERAITAAKLDGDIANAQLAVDSAKERTAGYANVLQTLLSRYDNQQAQKTAYEREDAANEQSYARQLALSIAQGGNMPTDELLSAAGMTRADAVAIVNSVSQSRREEENELKYSQALEKAETLAAYGDFSGYEALGYTAEQIAAMRATYDAATQKSGNTDTAKPLLTAAQTLSALESGVVNDSTLAAYEYWYGQPWQQTANVVDTANPLAGKNYDNEGLEDWQVSKMQDFYGLTPDGKWGPNSQSTTKMGAQEAWAAYQANNGIVDVEASWDGKTGQAHVKTGTDNGVFGTHIKEAYEGVRDLLLAGKTRDEVVAWLEERYEAYPTRLTQAGIDYLMAEVQGYEKLMTGGK